MFHKCFLFSTEQSIEDTSQTEIHNHVMCIIQEACTRRKNSIHSKSDASNIHHAFTDFANSSNSVP